MSHVDFKKSPCRCVKFKGQGPFQWQRKLLCYFHLMIKTGPLTLSYRVVFQVALLKGLSSNKLPFYTKKHRGGCTRVSLRPGHLITTRARSVRVVIKC